MGLGKPLLKDASCLLGTSRVKSDLHSRFQTWKCRHCQLGSYEEVPDFQRRPYILAGYRLNTKGLTKCLISVLDVHNETANIWTHLLGIPLVCLWAYPGMSDLLTQGSSVDIALFSLLYVVTLTCLAFSAFFHTCACDVESVSKRCLAMDLGGVILVVVVSFVIGISMGFKCMPIARSVYLVGVGGIAISLCAAVAIPSFSHGTRAIIFTCCGLLGVVPAVHFCILGSWSQVVTMVPYLAGLLFFYAGGAFIYACQWPECKWPGRFDYIGQSHNLWHLCVLAGMLTWLRGMQRMVALVDPCSSAS